MSHIVEELWIFSRDGIPLLEIFKNTDLDQALIGGFLSAMKSFTEGLSGKSLKSFSFGTEKFLMIPSHNDNIFLVSKYNSNVKEKVIQKLMNVIIKFFEEMYSTKDIEEWDGNINYFNKFKDRLEIYFELSQV